MRSSSFSVSMPRAVRGAFAMAIVIAASGRLMPASGESLHGRIVDRASLDASAAGKGIAGVRVILFDAAGKKLGVKATSKLGAYRFAKLAPGTYTLSIDRKGLLPSPLLR